MSSLTIDLHIKFFKEIFSLLQIFILNLNESNYHLFIKTLDFLGYVIDEKKVYIVDKRLELRNLSGI